MLSCYDRIVITGTLPGAYYAAGMTSVLNAKRIRIFGFPRFAEPLRERIRERAQKLCAKAGIEIEHIAKSHIRNEEVVAKVLARRGDHPGLVHVISARGWPRAMEACESYRPWHDKASRKTAEPLAKRHCRVELFRCGRRRGRGAGGHFWHDAVIDANTITPAK